MGVVEFGEGVGVELKGVLRVVLLRLLHLIAVATLQGFLDLVLRFVGQAQIQHLVLELQTPALVQVAGVGRPGSIVIVQDIVLVDGEVHRVYRCGQVLKDLLQARNQALAEALEDGETRVQVAFGQALVHPGAIDLEVADVRRMEKHAARVQLVQIVVQVRGGQRLVVFQFGIVAFFELPDQLDGGFCLVFAVLDPGLAGDGQHQGADQDKTSRDPAADARAAQPARRSDSRPARREPVRGQAGQGARGRWPAAQSERGRKRHIGHGGKTLMEDINNIGQQCWRHSRLRQCNGTDPAVKRVNGRVCRRAQRRTLPTSQRPFGFRGREHQHRSLGPPQAFDAVGLRRFQIHKYRVAQPRRPLRRDASAQGEINPRIAIIELHTHDVQFAPRGTAEKLEMFAQIRRQQLAHGGRVAQRGVDASPGAERPFEIFGDDLQSDMQMALGRPLDLGIAAVHRVSASGRRAQQDSQQQPQAASPPTPRHRGRDPGPHAPRLAAGRAAGELHRLKRIYSTLGCFQASSS